MSSHRRTKSHNFNAVNLLRDLLGSDKPADKPDDKENEYILLEDPITPIIQTEIPRKKERPKSPLANDSPSPQNPLKQITFDKSGNGLNRSASLSSVSRRKQKKKTEELLDEKSERALLKLYGETDPHVFGDKALLNDKKKMRKKRSMILLSEDLDLERTELLVNMKPNTKWPSKDSMSRTHRKSTSQPTSGTP
ncbi:hypothetical protein HK096_004533, partial [Nowakowskiella sp. JEL0078]